ncbi:MAG: penicillin acylase family protein, partial [Myxococcota bacterium]|nr:penicillin acylase family protein [Myxococcota bacterium]
DAVRPLQPLFPVASLPPEDRPATGGGSESHDARRGEAAGRSGQRSRAAEAAALRDAADALRALARALAPFRLVGSNNFALAGRHTANGRPLLGNDPHLPLQSPNVMVPIHLESASREGTLDVAGFTLAGSVGVSLGHNRHVAWSATTSFADVMDVWEVRDHGDAIEAWGQRFALVRHEEPLVVRGEGMPVGQGTSRAFVVREVPGIGPLLPRTITPIPIARSGYALLLGWVGWQPLGGAAALLALQRATNAAGVDDAVGRVPALGFNFVFADRETIGYRVGQAVPDRGAPSDARPPWLVLDGADPATRWTGALLDAARMPRSSGGSRGWIATANNDPFGFTHDGALDGDPWYYGAIFDPGYRAHRLHEELERLVARGAVSPEDLERVQIDARSPLADVLVPRLREAHGRLATDPALADLRDAAGLDALVGLLGEWDRAMVPGSAGAVAFRAFAFRLITGVLGDELGPLLDAALEIGNASILLTAVTANAVLGRVPGAARIVQQGSDRALLQAAAEVAAWMNERFGGVPGTADYGPMHGAVFDGPFRGALDRPFTPTRGAEDTIDNAPASFAMDATGRWESRHGPVFRAIYEWTDDGVPRMRVSFPLGVSAEPSSPHFVDRLEDWVAGRYARFPFTRDEIEARTVERTVLGPGS